MMRFVVTGGTGLIGGALVADLAAAGHRVVVLTRHPDADAGVPTGVELAGWDARTVGTWAERLDGADAVVHLAGENLSAGRWTAARKRRIRDSRVLSGRALAAAIARASRPPTVFVQASGVDYYGPRGGRPAEESSPPGDDFLSRICVEWEDATAPLEGLGVRRVIVRTALVLSREGGALPRLLLPFRFFGGGPLGSGDQWFSWIHLRDEVGAIRFLLERPDASGAFNLAAPQAVTGRELAATIGRVLGRPSWLRVPAPLLRAALGEMAEVLISGQRAEPARLESLGFGFRFPRLETALADLLAG